MEDEKFKIKPTDTFLFQAGSPDTKEILILTQKGFTYKGETVDDAGKGYKMFTEFMQNANTSRESLQKSLTEAQEKLKKFDTDEMKAVVAFIRTLRPENSATLTADGYVILSKRAYHVLLESLTPTEEG